MVTLHHITSDRQFALDIVRLKDDTEEDLVGSDAHQTAIRLLCDSLWLVGPERGAPWHVSSQLTVLMGKIEGKEWHPSPDIFVHPTGGLGPRTSWDAATEGVPPFVVEVASPATWEYDVSVKQRSYGYVGVQECLIFDPTSELLGTPVRAWHATEDGFVPWPPEADGRWHSAVLGIVMEPQGLLLRVYDSAGALVPIVGEQEQRAREQARRIAELEDELRQLRRETGDA